ncbi:MAG: PAS domain-containing protein [Flavobacterium sp.]
MEERLYLLNEMIKNATMPMAVYITKELIVECANPSMVNAWGKDDMAIGKKYLEVLPAIHKQQLFEQAMSVFETGIPAYAQNIKTDFLINDIVKSNYYNYNYIPLFNADKSIYGVMNIGTDVTSLQDAKQQIQLSEERLRMAIDNSGIGTYEIDLFTKKIKTSGNFNTLWSIDHQNVTNQELIAKLHPDDLNVREQAHEEAKYTGKIYYEARILNEDNSVRWVKIHGKIINDKNSSPATIIGIIQDYRQRKTI